MDADRPRLAGEGPATCSTSQVLDRPVIHDVNGYYRDLGVDVRATKHQIARRYQQVGQHDAHLTYVTKQLLNRAVRLAYDAAPYGSVFLDDEVLARIRRAQQIAVSEGRGSVFPEIQTKGRAASHLDNGSKVGEDLGSPAVWGYSYYLWETNRADRDRLRQWQEALVSALARRGVAVQVAVGSSGGTRPPVEAVKVGVRIAVFLHEQSSITDALAPQAVSPLVERVAALSDKEPLSWSTSVAVPRQPRRRRRAHPSPRPTTSPWRTGPRPSSAS